MADIFRYDEMDDSIIVSNKQDNEKVKDNFIFDNIVLSLTNSGKIVGLEIREISSYLKEMGFDPTLLNNIKNAVLIVKPKKDCVFIGINIQNPDLKMSNIIPITHLPINTIKN